MRLPFPATATEAAILTLGLAGVASAALNTFNLDYQPAAFDFLGFATGLDEQLWAGALAGEMEIIPSLTLFGAGGLYDGFSDYRSLWLNEYYRQQFAALPEYVAATRRGEQVSGGMRWEYLPALGFLQADVGYFHDEIAPGYEIDFDGLHRGRPDLYTTAYRLVFENILARRLRVMNEFGIGDTTNREIRYSYQGSLNLGPEPRSDGRLALRVTGQPGRLHRIESSPDLLVWSTESTFTPTSQDDLIEVEVEVEVLGASRFFRVAVP